AIACVLQKEKKKRRHKLWTKQWLERRNHFTQMDLLQELNKEDTNMRKAITPNERLTATLRYLATGRTLEDLKFSTHIFPQVLGRVIPETCEAIYNVLRKYCNVMPSVICLQCPTSQGEWKKVAKEFEDRWQFPNCIGAMDGVSDGGVFQSTDFYRKLKSGSLNVPKNFLRSKIQNQYTPLECLDDEDFETGNVTPGYRCSQFMDLERRQQYFPTQDAKLVGELFLEYFNNEGNVPWQDKFCF
ncbi:hypothetical protein B7P43_G03172, partial [Cryptotermes secundus]